MVSALKHGFFRRGFMLCDRCVLNGRCDSFVPGEDCALERKAYDRLVAELMGQYGLEGLADEILVQRAAMYLIRIARAEVYEANVGLSSKSAVWGKHIAGLDSTLRMLLKDLALTRSARKSAERDDLVVDVSRLLKSLEKKTTVKRTFLAQVESPMGLLLRDWEEETRKLEPAGEGEKGEEGSQNPEEGS